MQRTLQISVAFAALITGASVPARAGTYIPVPMVPGAVSEIVFGINDSNVVAGSFRDSANVEHGFFGPLDGSNWTVFDAPFEGTTGTEARGIANDGAIVGIALNPSFKVGEEFYRTPKGKFKVFSLNGEPLDGVAQGMNSSGASVGDYIDADGKTVGYIGQKGKYKKDFKLHLQGQGDFLQVKPRGLTDLGVLFVGSFTSQTGMEHGFLKEYVGPHDKRVYVIDYPASAGTALEDINNQLVASGQWEDSSGSAHAFTIDFSVLQWKLTDLNPGDSSTSQQAWGINDHGLVAISTSIGQSYIYCPHKNQEKCPAANSDQRLGALQMHTGPITRSAVR